MSSAVFEIPAVAIAAFFYLVLDTYPVVKSFKATLHTGSFYLFWLVLTTLNLIAYGVLKISAADKIDKLVGPGLAPLTLVLLATIGTIGVIQSLTIKLADFKFIDIGKVIEGFRVIVLADISKISADQERLLAMAIASKLSGKLDLHLLRTEYAAVMRFAGRTDLKIAEELNQLEKDVAAGDFEFKRAIAERIAQVDIRRAQQLLRGL
ncbi:MAG: hypothetical protein DMF60_20265 [Acidobacteria bacterium]|nr:MAG: hypothetical protein DMF60_20265 [Acidobacteriota bacterium]